MFAEMPSRAPGEVRSLQERRLRKPQVPAGDQTPSDGAATSMDLGATLPERVTRLPRDTKLRFGKARHFTGMSSPTVHISQENQP